MAELFAHCSTGCTVGTCRSYGECLRSKGARVAYCDSSNLRDATRERKWNKELDRARNLMSQGIRPDNTFGAALDRAERVSDATGVPYRAGE